MEAEIFKKKFPEIPIVGFTQIFQINIIWVILHLYFFRTSPDVSQKGVLIEMIFKKVKFKRPG